MNSSYDKERNKRRIPKKAPKKIASIQQALKEMEDVEEKKIEFLLKELENAKKESARSAFATLILSIIVLCGLMAHILVHFLNNPGMAQKVMSLGLAFVVVFTISFVVHLIKE